MLQKLITVFGVRPSKIMNTESIRKTADMTSTSVRSMIELGEKGRYRVETFDQAIKRLGLDEEKLVRRKKELMLESRIAYVMMFATMLSMFHFVSIESWNGLVSGSCAFIIFLCVGLTRAFRVHQIDKRELMDFPTFLQKMEGLIK